MSSLRASLVPPLLALPLLWGCGHSTTLPPDPLDTGRGVAEWANRASALGVFFRIHDVVAAGDLRDPFPDPDCPRIVAEGSTVTIQGGCTDRGDELWVGSATVENLSAEDEDLVIDGFGHTGTPGVVAVTSGTASLRGLPDGSHSYALDLTIDSPREGLLTIAYDGRVDGGYTGPTVWNGAGTVTLDDDSVDAMTVDQVRDSGACQGQSASGQTTLTSAMHTAVVTYDGAVDCDEDDDALWSLDGTPRGKITGVTCSVGGWGAPPLAGLLLALAVAVFVRRRAVAAPTA